MITSVLSRRRRRKRREEQRYSTKKEASEVNETDADTSHSFKTDKSTTDEKTETEDHIELNIY